MSDPLRIAQTESAIRHIIFSCSGTLHERLKQINYNINLVTFWDGPCSNIDANRVKQIKNQFLIKSSCTDAKVVPVPLLSVRRNLQVALEPGVDPNRIPGGYNF